MMHFKEDVITLFNESALEYRALPRVCIGDANFQRVSKLQHCDQDIVAKLVTNLSLDYKSIYQKSVEMTYNEVVNYYNFVYEPNTDEESRYTIDELFDTRYHLYEFMIGLIISAAEYQLSRK